MAKKIFILSNMLLGALVSYDIFLLYHYAFDLPFWDTWELLPRGNWSRLFSFFNENMQFFYFVISETLYALAGWNLRWFVFVNFLIYLGLIFLYNKILLQAEAKKIPYYPLFFCIVFSPILGYNWLWELLVQTHTFILFFLAAIYAGFTKDSSKYSPYFFAVFLFLSIIAMNIPLAAGGLMAYVIKEVVNIKENGKPTAVRKCGTVICIMLVLLLLLSQITTIGQFIAIRLTNQVFTMEYLLNLSFYLINGFGMFVLASQLNAKICVFLLFIHFAILAVVFFEQYKIKKCNLFGGLSLVFCFVSQGLSHFGAERYTPMRLVLSDTTKHCLCLFRQRYLF